MEQSHKRQKRAAVVQFVNCFLVRNDSLIWEDLWLQEDKIIDPQPRFWKAKREHRFAADVIVDCGGLIIAPGFIDLQINGAFGVDFSSLSGELKEDGKLVGKVAKGLLAHGVTSFVPTIITSAPETYRRVLPVLASQMGRGSASSGANVLGAHLEGPFISNMGAHPAFLRRDPSQGFADVRAVYGDDLSCVKIVTIAPELPGALAAIQELSAAGVCVSIGHTNASFEQSLAGCRAVI
jgi:N-acetylglucosamine-6-phosphate deacetylase